MIETLREDVLRSRALRENPRNSLNDAQIRKKLAPAGVGVPVLPTCPLVDFLIFHGFGSALQETSSGRSCGESHRQASMKPTSADRRRLDHESAESKSDHPRSAYDHPRRGRLIG